MAHTVEWACNPTSGYPLRMVVHSYWLLRHEWRGCFCFPSFPSLPYYVYKSRQLVLLDGTISEHTISEHTMSYLQNLSQRVVAASRPLIPDLSFTHTR